MYHSKNPSIFRWLSRLGNKELDGRARGISSGWGWIEAFAEYETEYKKRDHYEESFKEEEPGQKLWMSFKKVFDDKGPALLQQMSTAMDLLCGAAAATTDGGVHLWAIDS